MYCVLLSQESVPLLYSNISHVFIASEPEVYATQEIGQAESNLAIVSLVFTCTYMLAYNVI